MASRGVSLAVASRVGIVVNDSGTVLPLWNAMQRRDPYSNGLTAVDERLWGLD